MSPGTNVGLRTCPAVAVIVRPRCAGRLSPVEGAINLGLTGLTYAARASAAQKEEPQPVFRPSAAFSVEKRLFSSLRMVGSTGFEPVTLVVCGRIGKFSFPSGAVILPIFRGKLAPHRLTSVDIHSRPFWCRLGTN